MGWIRCVRCENFRRNFVAPAIALIAPVQPILHRVSCSNEMIPNAPKHYETQQKLSLWSNGVDQVRSLRKLPTQLCGTNFCIVQHILHWVYFVALSLGSNGVDWVRSLWKHLTRLRGTNFWINCTASTHFAPKHYETQQKLSLGSIGVDQVRSLRKHPMQLRGMNFCINWTSSAHFALSLLS